MTTALPPGLIKPIPTRQYASDDSQPNLTNSEVVRRMWKVHSLQSELTADSTNTRARNLFWRVWSSPNLTESMSSSTLMRLLKRCGEAFDYTPLSPLQRPASLYIHQTKVENEQYQQTTPEIQKPQSIREQSQPNEPPSLSARVHGDNTPGHTSNTTSESGSRPSPNRASSGGRSRLPVVAGGARSRHRPHLGRGKSTAKSAAPSNIQKSPKGDAEAAPSSNLRHQESAYPSSLPRPTVRGPPPVLPDSPVRRPVPVVDVRTESGWATNMSATTLAPLGAGSWQSIGGNSDNAPLAATAPQPPLGELVGRGFRGKFVENQKRMASFTNLVGLGRMKKSVSTVRFADEMPEVAGKGKGKERGSPSPEPERPVSSALKTDSDTDDNSEDAGPEIPLLRTKSQLSLMIKHRRSETGSQDLGPQEAAGMKMPGKEKTKEEELLSMGRRDGVTKAGGVQVPKQQRASEHAEPRYYSPSSPEPLF